MIPDFKSINFIKRRYDLAVPLIKRELKDQEPCYYKKSFDENGFDLYFSAIIESVTFFMIQTSFPDFVNMEEEEEIEKSETIQNGLYHLFKDMAKNYYDNVDCVNEY